jgi:hypothetical protein
MIKIRQYPSDLYLVSNKKIKIRHKHKIKMYLALGTNPNFRIKMINKICNLFLDNQINQIQEILIHNLIKIIYFKVKINKVNL